MLIDKTKIDKKITKLSEEGSACAMQIDSEGSLILNNGKKLVVPNFAVFHDGSLFLGAGLSRSQTEVTPHNIGVQTLSKLLLIRSGGETADYITPTKPAEEDTRFLCYAIFPNVVELSFVSPMDRRFHRKLFKNGTNDVWFAELLAKTLLKDFSPEAFETFEKFVTEEMKNFGKI